MLHARKITNEVKQAVFACGLTKEVAKASYQNFKGNSSYLDELKRNYGDFVVKVSMDFNNAMYNRRKRIKKRIGDYIHFGHGVFLTLTFTDDVLSSTSKETRRKYVRRWLKKNCLHYVANIDFGGKYGREHYHALVMCGNVDYKSWHKYGAIKGEKIKTSETDILRTCKYVAKLTNHALKDTATMPRLIYSRVSFEEKVKKAKFLADAF